MYDFEGKAAIERGFEIKKIPTDLKIVHSVGRSGRNEKKDVTIISWYLTFYFMSHPDAHFQQLLNTINKNPEVPSSAQEELIFQLQKELHKNQTGTISPSSDEFYVLLKNAIPILSFVGKHNCHGSLKYFLSSDPHQARNLAALAVVGTVLLLGVKTSQVRAVARFLIGSANRQIKSVRSLNTNGENLVQDVTLKSATGMTNPSIAGVDLFGAIDVADKFIAANEVEIMSISTILSTLKFIFRNPLFAILGGVAVSLVGYKLYDQYDTIQTCKADLDEALHRAEGVQEEHIKEMRGLRTEFEAKQQENMRELKAELNRTIEEIQSKSHVHRNATKRNREKLKKEVIR